MKKLLLILLLPLLAGSRIKARDKSMSEGETMLALLGLGTAGSLINYKWAYDDYKNHKRRLAFITKEPKVAKWFVLENPRYFLRGYYCHAGLGTICLLPTLYLVSKLIPTKFISRKNS
jgi:hypothetical protein